ncbi:MAG: hypothetical protein JXR23_10715 [Pontiellaceae bacterium]|nr:hypothetical protein [Pontiellaceae bacterium]
MKTGIKMLCGVVVLAGVGFAGVYYGKQLGKEDAPKRVEPPSATTAATSEYSAEAKEPVAATPPELREVLSDAAVVVLSEKVDEVGESETVQRVLKEVLSGELPPDDVNREVVADVAVDVLAEHVEEIGESETVKSVLKDLAGGGSFDTNAPSPTATDIAVDILGEQVDEVGGNEVLKDILKGFGNSLFN